VEEKRRNIVRIDGIQRNEFLGTPLRPTSIIIPQRNEIVFLESEA